MRKKNSLSTPIIVFLFCSISILPYFFASLSVAGTVQAREWEIDADRITHYDNPAMIIGEGNVIIEKKEVATRIKPVIREQKWSGLLGDSSLVIEDKKDLPEAGTKLITTEKSLTTIRADWISYDLDSAIITARGNLLIDIGTDRIAADEGTVDLDRETGSFTNATIIRTYKDIHIEGRIIEKTGAVTYRIEDGWIITCQVKEGETPPWSFAAADTKITDGGYAVLKHATFRIKDVPVFYTPIMVLPAKRTRQTGFLFPGFAYSGRDGFDLTTPFFINLSPSSDITFYPQYMSKRGLMAGMEYRYVSSPQTMGFFMANYLDDKLSDRSDIDNAEYFHDGNYTHDNQNRYWLRGKSNHKFGLWQARLDIDTASDLDYLTEFNSGYTGFINSHERVLDTFGRGFQNKSELARTNTFKLLRFWDNGSALQVNLSGINDLREVKNKNDPFWKLPAINYTGITPIYDTGVNFSWDTDYTHFWREHGVRGQRFDIPLRLSRGLPLSPYLETTVDGGIRNTSYFIDGNDDSGWSDSENENRFLFDFGGRIGSILSRDFGVDIGKVNKLNHLFRPYISYRYLYDVDQQNLPNFSGIDRIDGQNIIHYGLDNFFSVFGRTNDSEYKRDYGYLKIRQGYDLRDKEELTPWTPLEIKAGFYPLESLRLGYRSDIDVYGEGLIKQSLESSYVNQRGDSFFIDYFFNNQESEIQQRESVKAGFTVYPFHFIRASYDIEHSLTSGKTIQDNFSITYMEQCWSVSFGTSYTPGDRKFMIIFNLANIGTPFGFDLPDI